MLDVNWFYYYFSINAIVLHARKPNMQLRRYWNRRGDGLYKRLWWARRLWDRRKEINTVSSGLSGWAVRWWCTDNWETCVIRNIYFIETRAKNRTVSCYVRNTYLAYAWNILISLLKILFEDSALNHVVSNLLH